jgi:hypothetical protein
VLRRGHLPPARSSHVDVPGSPHLGSIRYTPHMPHRRRTGCVLSVLASKIQTWSHMGSASRARRYCSESSRIVVLMTRSSRSWHWAAHPGSQLSRRVREDNRTAVGRCCRPSVKRAFFMSSEQSCTDSHCQWAFNEDKWRSLTPSHEMSGE